MKLLKLIAILPFLMGADVFGKTVDSTAALDQILSGDSRTANILGDASQEVRDAALEAALYPDVLDRLTQQQKDTSSQFQNLISTYPRKTQEKAYNLVRYPELMQDLVSGGPKSKDQIKSLTRDYPKSIQDAAQDLGRKEYPMLEKVQSLYTRSDQDFDQSLRSLPGETQRAYHTLLSNPEVLTALSNDRSFTLALGQAYRANPEATRTRINDLGSSNDENQQTALQDYRNTLNSDPKAREELKKSTKDFAKQYGYNDDADSDYPPPTYNNNDSGSTVVSININPYPFWFGYPTWYVAPLWRPYPLWYLSGYYGYGYGYGGGYVWGWPSYYYSNWFYRTPYHFARYPYLASCYGNYYHRWYNHPVNNSFYRTVNNWHYYNRNYINQDLWRNDRYSSNRWRDFGNSQEWRRRGQGSPNPAFRPPNQSGHWQNDAHQYSGQDQGDHPSSQQWHDKQRGVDGRQHHGQGWQRNGENASNQPSNHGGQGKDRNWRQGHGNPTAGGDQGQGQYHGQGQGHHNKGGQSSHADGGNTQANQQPGGSGYGNSGNSGNGAGQGNSGYRDRSSSAWNSGGSSSNRGGGSWNGGSSSSSSSSSWGSRSSSGGFGRSSSSFGGGGGGGFHGSSFGGFSRGRR